MTALKDHADFYHIINSVRKWGPMRAIPENLHYVTEYEKGKYDFALLHIDQQCIISDLGKAKLFKELNEVVTDIPKIVINHGTPFWPEIPNGMTEKEIVTEMKMLLKGTHVVVNSHRAKELWGNIGETTRTIIHGMDDEGWMDLPKEPRVVSAISPRGLDRYYNRKLLIEVRKLCNKKGIRLDWIPVDVSFENGEQYKEFVGRSLISFNPTLESPMPRSRTEAMFSGCCVVTLPNHGAEEFIKHGVNGFHVPNNPYTVVELLEALMLNYDKCIEIGQEGKKTAQKIFTKERFKNDWLKLIKEVLKI
jgi:glycosyltransferase involved in cell wall biosynthesis